MSKKYDFAVVIGRFQPLHKGHVQLIQHANSLANKTIILIGSARQAPSPKNPFSYSERETFINLLADAELIDRPLIAGIQDDIYDDTHWVRTVQATINMIVGNHGSGAKIALVGYSKDASSEYLKWFPQFALEESPQFGIINATDIRQEFYDTYALSQNIPKLVNSHIVNNCMDTFNAMRDEYHFIKRYQAPYEKLPFKPVFVTVDAVTICQGHILLVKRKALPGKGLWALPGGFLDSNEFITPAILRELREETGLATTEDKIRTQRVFDAPQRSQRGRTITHCGLIVLNDEKLPKVKGSDDAEKAKWFPLHEFFNMSEKMFEDHFSIASRMIRLS